FYLSEHHFQDEQSRLFQKMEVEEPESNIIQNESAYEQKTIQYQEHFHHLLEHKIQNVQKVFSYGKPTFVYLFMLISICMFIWLESTGGSTNIQNLIQKGALYYPAILEGQWWKIGRE